MRFIIKFLFTLIIILTCTQIAKKLPSLAGLIAVMPLTGLLVMVWIYLDNHGDVKIMTEFTKGALWGILPSILFFLASFFCFRKQLPLSIALSISFAIWLTAAVLHQWLLNR